MGIWKFQLLDGGPFLAVLGENAGFEEFWSSGVGAVLVQIWSRVMITAVYT
jgi:hypothetical protein